MLNSKKLLSIVFVILFIVLLGEIGYIAYSTYFKKATPVGNKEEAPIEALGSTIQVVEERGGEPAVPETNLNALYYLNKGVVSSLTTTAEYLGKIIELENQDELRIRIEGLDGETNTFTYNQEEVATAQIFQQNEQGIAETAVLSDLKVGQAVLIQHSVNLLEDLNINTISLKITILNQ